MTPTGADIEGYADATGAFLGVRRSLTGRRWQLRPARDRNGLAICQQLGVPDLVGRIISARGLGPDEAEAFLNPTVKRFLCEPNLLAGMEAAVARLVRAIKRGEKVAVFGDYDVDGATSAALLKRFFRAIGRDIRIYVPDRVREGYGPNTEAMQRLQNEGFGLVITVDCGIAAFEPLADAAGRGLDVIVVDHHAAEPALPQACAVVDPNRLDDTSGQGALAAVGVTYLLVIALNRALRDAGWYRQHGEPDLLQWLDLVALGTVCDVVPLVGLNRAFVSQGLRILHRRRNAGLAALLDVARIDSAADAYHLGFLIGPRVNAGGRVGQADLGARLLSIEDANVAAELASRLDRHNAERRSIEQEVLDAAVAQLSVADVERQPLVVASGEGWHPGVIGIVASRLKDRCNRPSLVVSFANGVGKGSGRSVQGVDLGNAVIAAKQAGLLINGGGHAMAAGLTVRQDRSAELFAFLSERVGQQMAAAGYEPSLSFDGALSMWAVSAALVKTLEKLAPFGAGNAEPRFAVPSARVVKAEVVGGDHVRCIFTNIEGGRLKGVAFRAVETPLGRTLLSGGAPIHIAGRLRADTWAGRNAIQFIIEDAAPAAG
jgi:single-stranded-DNA-specific exonuclease